MKRANTIILKVILILVTLSGLQTSGIASDQSTYSKVWTKQYGTSEDDEYSVVTTDDSGNIYITGTTGGSLDGNTNAGEDDIFLTKFSSDGTKIWTKQYGSSDLDYPFSIITDSSGNIYIAGSTFGSLDGNSNAGGSDIFLSKFSSDGIKIWTKQYGTSGYDYSNSVTSDNNGNIYITGTTGGSLDGNTNAGEDDIFLTKFSSDGTKIWTKQYGTSDFDGAYSIAIDSSGNIYISGDTWGSLDGNTNAGGGDVFLTKYASDNAITPIKKTGQTTSYTDFDDGFYQKGITPSYTRDNSKEIVTDNVTSLEWQDTMEVAHSTHTWQVAIDYCSTLPLDGGGWRLPSIEELETLTDDGEYDPSVTTNVFQYTSSSNYWSSTTYAYIIDNAWSVYFKDGNSDDTTKTSNHYVRCVRGKPIESTHTFNRNNVTEIVDDTTTGLQWQDDEVVRTSRRAWQEAIDYCENNLTLGGFNDWRLPNKRELLSIADRSRYEPSIDTTVFVNTASYEYWSSSTYIGISDYNYPWRVTFYRGHVDYDMPRDSYVRCVRGEQLDLPFVVPPVIEASGDPDAEYKFSVTLEEPLPEGYYVAVNFDDEQGDWFTQADPGGHIILSNLSGTTYWLNRTLYKPGLRSFRAGIFDPSGQLVGEYSDFTTCTTDGCLANVIQENDYGNPLLSGSGSQLLRGVDVSHGNFHHASTDMSVPGKGPDFTLIRAYNSRSGLWSFNLDANATFTPDTFNRQIAIGPREDGRMQYFFKDMDQLWYALSPGNFDQLIEESDGSFTLYTQGNLFYRFAAPLSLESGRLESIHDRDGNALTFTHTSNRITGATDASDRSYSITRDANGRITGASDFTQRSVAYTWNTDDMLTSFRNPREKTVSYGYNVKKLISITDPKNNTQYLIAYYTSGDHVDRVLSVTDAANNLWNYTYTSTLSATNTYGTGVERPSTDGVNNNIVFVIDEKRTKVLMRIDTQNVDEYKTKIIYKTTDNRQRIAELSLAVQTESPSGAQTDIAYIDDGKGNPGTITDAKNRVTEASWTTVTGQDNLTPMESLKQPGVNQPTQYMSFTSSGKAQQIINPLGDSSYLTYNSTGLMTQTKDARNNMTNITYDMQGRPTHITDALNNVSEIVYNELGRVSSKKNARGYTTSYTYDANGNVLTTTDPKNGITTYTYDNNDNVTSVKDARNNTVSFVYDTSNRKAEERYSVSGVQYVRKFEYDALNRVHRVINESNHANQMQFDVRGNVVKEINPLSQNIIYTYDANGNGETITDAEGRRVTYEYDTLDRKTKATDALGFYEQYTYSTQGMLATKRDKKGRLTSYEYDALGQMTKVIQPDGAFTQATYDANGNIATTTDRKNQTVTYTYNAINQMTEQEDAVGRKWKFTYDANGNMLTRTLPSNKVTSYTYDNLDRVTQVQYPDSQTVNYTYDANGNRLSMQDAQGTTNYTYDELNRLTQVTDSFGNSIGYTFHPIGTLKELIYPDNKKVTYSYDNAGRLDSLSDWLGDETSYSRDDSGLTKLVTYGNGTTVEKDYDASGRLTSLSNKTGATTISSHVMTLDPVGNPTNIAADIPLLPGNLGKAAEMLYDSSNRLTSIDTKPITHDVDGRITADDTNIDPISYAYNAQDLITSVINNSVTTDEYTYDGDGKRIARTTGGQTTRYVQDPTGGDLYSLLAETNSTNGIQHYYVYGEGLVSQIRGTDHKYYHFDQSGNTLALTNDSGMITDKYAYEPFGNTTMDGTSHNPFRFVGQYGVMDDGNGLHHMRARYYKADMRRFMSLDALYGQVTDPMALNRYQYVSGNPMVGVDPSGYCEMFSLEYGSCSYELANGYVESLKFIAGESIPTTLGDVEGDAETLISETIINDLSALSGMEKTIRSKIVDIGKKGAVEWLYRYDYISSDTKNFMNSYWELKSESNVISSLHRLIATGNGLPTDSMNAFGIAIENSELGKSINYKATQFDKDRAENITKNGINAIKNGMSSSCKMYTRNVENNAWDFSSRALKAITCD